MIDNSLIATVCNLFKHSHYVINVKCTFQMNGNLNFVLTECMVHLRFMSGPLDSGIPQGVVDGL